MKRTVFVAFFCLIAGLAVADTHSQAIRTVALSGQPAPGTSEGVTFDGFSGYSIQPRIDNVGSVFFFARLKGVGVDVINDTGVWMDDGGSIALVAREFDHAPGYFQGQPDGEFSEVGIILGDFLEPTYVDPPNPKVSGDDQVLVRTDFIGYDENEEFIVGQALYRIRDGGLEIAAGARMPAPGLSPATEFRQFEQGSLNSNGNIAFSSKVYDRSIFDDTGIWTDVRGELELVAMAGGQVPGMPSGVTIYSRVYDPVLNSQGKLAFGAPIREPDSSAPSRRAILAGVPGALDAIVREGDHAPGTPMGTTFDNFFGQLEIDDVGRVLFHGALIGAGIGETNNQGLWLEDAGAISLVAREGDQAPDLPSGVTFASFDRPNAVNVLFNEEGQLALGASLTGTGIDNTNNSAIWAGTPDSLELIVQKGDLAPGIGEPFGQVYPMDLNEAGRLAIVGNLPGTVVGGTSERGIWAQDASGELQLIVKSGDLLEVAPGDFREVWQMQFGGFNDRGQVVFRASLLGPGGDVFSSTQGIFVSNLVAVPEPAALGLIVACLAICGVTRRRK